jgi:hypothetical protein
VREREREKHEKRRLEEEICLLLISTEEKALGN